MAAAEILLSLCPSAAAFVANGSKPLHIACRVGRSASLASAVLKRHPAASREFDGSGDLPLHCVLRRFRELDAPHGAAEALALALLDANPAAAPERDAARCLPAVLASPNHAASGILIDRIFAVAPDTAIAVKNLRHFEGLEERMRSKVLETVEKIREKTLGKAR